MTLARWMLALAFSLALSGCQRDPRCRGELSQQEIVRLRDLTARGAAPCPELGDPRIQLGAKGIELSGRVIVPRAEVPRDGFARPIGPLLAELAQNRETWNRVHPQEKFDGRASLEIAADSDFIAAGSTITSAVQAGYPRARVVSAGVSFDASFELSRSASGSAERQRDLYLERRNDGGYTAVLKEGRIVVSLLENVTALDRVTSWVDLMCDATRCDVIELHIPGEFQLTAHLLRRLLDLKSLASRPPRFRFKGAG